MVPRQLAGLVAPFIGAGSIGRAAGLAALAAAIGENVMPALSPSLSEMPVALSPSELTEDGVDRRRHERFPLTLTGRYMLPDGAEYPCESSDVAVGGLSIKGPRPGRVGVTAGRAKQLVAQFGESEAGAA